MGAQVARPKGLTARPIAAYAEISRDHSRLGQLSSFGDNSTHQQVHYGMVPDMRLGSPRADLPDDVYTYRQLSLVHRPSSVSARGVIRTDNETVRVTVTPAEGTVPGIEIAANSPRGLPIPPSYVGSSSRRRPPPASVTPARSASMLATG